MTLTQVPNEVDKRIYKTHPDFFAQATFACLIHLILGYVERIRNHRSNLGISMELMEASQSFQAISTRILMSESKDICNDIYIYMYIYNIYIHT